MAGMVVQHNMNALNAYNKLNTNVNGLKKSSEKLSSGYRINRAGDDAAGLAISEKMRSQIRGLNQAKRNSQDGISMIQTFEGALQETHSILQRMKELATESANGTYDNATDRAAIQLEFDQLNDELNQIADTDFNGTVALNGGTMADGTKANSVTGAIDYSTATRAAGQLGTAGGYVMGIGSDDYTGTTEETVTFTATVDADTGAVTWEAGANATGTLAANDDNGGFTYNGASINIDTTKVVTGDTVTIKFGVAKDEQAHTSEVVGSNTTYANDIQAADAANLNDLELAIEDDVVTNQAIADAINGLNGLEVTSTTTAGTTNVTTKVNGVALPTGNTPADLFETDDGKVTINKSGEIEFTPTGGTAVKIATLTEGTMGDNAVATGDLKTTFLVSTSSYVPEQKAVIEVVEPDSQVSAANAYDNSVAKMTYAKSITLQVGARTKDAVDFTFSYESEGIGELNANLDVSAREGGLNTANLSLANQDDANYAIDQIDNAINKVSMVRATFGSIQNRLEHKIENLTTTSENLTEAESSIRDTDMASEMLNYTKYNILQQAAQSMLAQANQQPQSILQLLG